MKKIGFGITSLFCTIPKVMNQLLLLREEGYDIYNKSNLFYQD